MELTWLFAVTFFFLISIFFFVQTLTREHNDWIASWDRFAECASIVKENGTLVNPTNFKGFFHGFIVELQVVSRGGYEVGARHVFTCITIHLHNSYDGYLSIIAKLSSRGKQLESNHEDLNDYFQITSKPQMLETIFLSSLFKKKLLSLQISKFVIEANKLILWIPGVETDLDILYPSLLLLYKIAQDYEEKYSSEKLSY